MNRIFLDWTLPPALSVAEHLIPSRVNGEVDLSDTTLIVPTRQAGRRLRDALALRAESFGRGLRPPRVLTPTLFPWIDAAHGDSASLLESWLAWVAAIKHSPADALRPLAPMRPEGEIDVGWALGMARQLQRLRVELADGGWTFAAVAACEDIEERERWQCLSALEERFLNHLSRSGRRDASSVRLELAADPPRMEGLKRVVLAATLDPALLLLETLERLHARGVEIEVLVQAPPSKSDAFDRWGRPLPDAWNDFAIDIPDAERNLLLEAGPEAQALRMASIISDERERVAREGVGLGVPDAEVAAALPHALGSLSIEVFDPRERALSDTGLFRLVEALLDLRHDGGYRALSALLRHGDVLRALRAEGSEPTRDAVSTVELLGELDRFQNAHLPARFDELRERLRVCTQNRSITPEVGAKRTAANMASGGYPRLSAAVERVAAWMPDGHASPLDALRDVLADIYAARRIAAESPEGRRFADVVESFDRVLREAEALDGTISVPLLEASFKARLREQHWQPERGEEALDMEGWLEMPWNPAPLLIVSGMNEGIVPDTRLGDAFLPDSLRTRLNLRDDRHRLARDACVLITLLEARRATGRVCLLSGKTSRAGDPLRPSRLLFRCPRETLPHRARRLFGPADDTPAGMPVSVGFQLDPALLAGAPREVGASRERMSVSHFRAYLACPLRFYFDVLCGLESVADDRLEPDAMDFGTLLHDALEAMGRDSRLWSCDDAEWLARELCAIVDRRVCETYGREPPLGVIVALESARERLAALARVQVADHAAGWEILRVEMPVDISFGKHRVRGRIDRLDRHADGRLRVLDYKTGDRAKTPAETHLGGGVGEDTPAYAVLDPTLTPVPNSRSKRPRRWTDLQLPLYIEALRGEFPFAQLLPCYGVLPKAVLDTAFLVWDGYGETLHEHAMSCARGVLADIAAGRFWPPAAHGRRDEPLQHLFPVGLEAGMRIDGLRPPTEDLSHA